MQQAYQIPEFMIFQQKIMLLTDYVFYAESLPMKVLLLYFQLNSKGIDLSKSDSKRKRATL